MIGYILGAVGALAYFFFTTPAKAKASTGGLVQTAKVGDNVYTITRLGNGQYVVVLTSIKGSTNQFPVSVMLDQTGIKQEFGDPTQLAQLKADMNKFSIDFSG